MALEPGVNVPLIAGRASRGAGSPPNLGADYKLPVIRWPRRFTSRRLIWQQLDPHIQQRVAERACCRVVPFAPEE